MRALILALTVFFTTANAASALRITYNEGGYVGVFAHQYEQLLWAGETFEIDDLCASACTLVLQAPSDKICVTKHAVLGFHAATDKRTGKEDPFGSEYVMNRYPQILQDWINRHGGLTLTPLFLKGPELERMFRPCNGTLPAIY
jgi:hypothetical protein